MRTFQQYVTEVLHGGTGEFWVTRSYNYREIGTPGKSGADWEDWGWLGADGLVYRPNGSLIHDEMAQKLWNKSRTGAVIDGNVRFGAIIQAPKKIVAFEFRDSQATRHLVIRYLEKLPADEDVSVHLGFFIDQHIKSVVVDSVKKAVLRLRNMPLTEAKETGLPDFMDQVVATTQRGAPEAAMLKVQFAMGGGVLNGVVEHIGDLTHRMTEKVTWDSGGYAYVTEKVDKVLRWLTNRYGVDSHGGGFAKEMGENIKHNAEYRKVPEAQLGAKVDAALAQYADAHRKMPVFNDVQRLARDTAVAIGEQQWGTAIDLLAELHDILQRGRSTWTNKAHEVDWAAVDQYCMQHSIQVPRHPLAESVRSISLGTEDVPISSSADRWGWIGTDGKAIERADDDSYALTHGTLIYKRSGLSSKSALKRGYARFAVTEGKATFELLDAPPVRRRVANFITAGNEIAGPIFLELAQFPEGPRLLEADEPEDAINFLRAGRT